MAQLTAISLADGQATPVNHTFSPIGVDQQGIARLEDRSTGIALGFPTISMSVRRPTKALPAYKVVGKAVLPVLEVTSPSTSSGIQPAPTKAFDLPFNFDFVLPSRATLAQRADILAFAKNFVAHAVVAAAVKDLDPIW